MDGWTVLALVNGASGTNIVGISGVIGNNGTQRFVTEQVFYINMNISAGNNYSFILEGTETDLVIVSENGLDGQAYRVLVTYTP